MAQSFDTFDTWAFCDMQLRRLFKRPLSAISDRFEVNLAKLRSFGISDNLNAGPDFRTDVIRQMIMAFRGRTESINPSSIEFMINHDPELDSYLKNPTSLKTIHLKYLSYNFTSRWNPPKVWVIFMSQEKVKPDNNFVHRERSELQLKHVLVK